MIIGDNREQVIQNIKEAVNSGKWDAKVEVGDPVLSIKESKELVNAFGESKKLLREKLIIGLATCFSIL